MLLFAGRDDILAMSREVQPRASDLTPTSSLCAQANDSFLYARGLQPRVPRILNTFLHKGIVAGRGHGCQWGPSVPDKASQRNSWERSRNREDMSPASTPCPQAQGPSPQEVTPLMLIPQRGEALLSYSQITGGASQSLMGDTAVPLPPPRPRSAWQHLPARAPVPTAGIFSYFLLQAWQPIGANCRQPAGPKEQGSAAQESYLNPSRPSPSSWGRGWGRNQNNSSSQSHKGRAIPLCRTSDGRACSSASHPPWQGSLS